MWYLQNKIEQGRRNNALFIAAIKYGHIADMLDRIREKAINIDGLSPAEVDKTIASAARYRVNVEFDPAAIMSRLFAPLDTICITKKVGNKFTDSFLDFEEANSFVVNLTSEPGVEYFYRINSTTGKSDKDVKGFTNALIECDGETLERQIELLELIKPIAVCAYYSGSKSLHIIARVGASGIDDYKQRVRELHDLITSRGYAIDKACKNPSRLSRLPYSYRDGVLIEPVYVSDNIENFDDFIVGISLPESIKRIGLPKAIGAEGFAAPSPVLIEGVMRCGQKCIISGSAKIGKSLSMLWLASALVEGGEWYGLKCRESNVLYINVEIDAYTMRQRADDMTATGIDCRFVDVWNLRGCFNRGREVIDAVNVVAKRRKYDVVIFDPVYLLLDGDESDASVTKQFLNRIDQLIVSTGCSVILVHHFAKGMPGSRSMIDRASGSSNFARWADAFITFSPLATKIKNAFRFECISRSLLSPHPSEWVLNYPVFSRIHGEGIKILGEAQYE